MMDKPFVDFKYEGCLHFLFYGRYFIEDNYIRLSFGPLSGHINHFHSIYPDKLLHMKSRMARSHISKVLRECNIQLLRDEFGEMGDVIFSWAFACKSIREQLAIEKKNAEALREQISTLRNMARVRLADGFRGGE